MSTNRIAIVGANSQIARDLVRRLAAEREAELLLFVRDVSATTTWVRTQILGDATRVQVHAYDDYAHMPHDAVINFVGVGDPRRAAAMGADIFAVTQQFDDMILEGLTRKRDRRYIFLSSGAAYGDNFGQPVDDESAARFPLNYLGPQDYYGAAKFHAEVRHRSRPDCAIVDLRVFNYFSRTQDLTSRFFISDIVRAVQELRPLLTSADPIVRDYLHPDDFHALVSCVFAASPQNSAIDCYSREPVGKAALLDAFQRDFGLRFETATTPYGNTINATGTKPHYYSLSRKAAGLGYLPSHSSLTGVLEEAAALLGSSSSTSKLKAEKLS